MLFQTKLLSSLSKVFADRELIDKEIVNMTALKDEVFSFQIAMKQAAFPSEIIERDLEITVNSELKDFISIRKIIQVPGIYLGHSFDDYIIQDHAGIFPDRLEPLQNNRSFRFPPKQWHALWVTVNVPKNIAAKIYDIELNINYNSHPRKELHFKHKRTFKLEILNAILPEQKIKHTEWFHTDCLMTQYNCEAWSPKHWELIGNYMKNSAEHGTNMILTPLFTLTLDTAIGGERPTHQLVKVNTKDEKINASTQYHFDFTLLKKWIKIATEAGMKYFELSHLFTQWGAKHAPKIIATINGKEQQIFGWETIAAGSEYCNFLEQFIPKLIAFIDEKNIHEKIYFHIADEPPIEALEDYKKSSDIVKNLLKGQNFKTIDALSELKMFEDGLIETPIPRIDEVDEFYSHYAKHDNPEKWCYYCIYPMLHTTNRFFHFPSARNRILGLQLYKYEVQGFLHWGYNFWNAIHSTHKINPFSETDADIGFPAGDSYLVYPGKDGQPLDSIRSEVLREAFQDVRACQLLESLIGRDATINALEDNFGEITMLQYPRDKTNLLNIREKINYLISKNI